MPAASSSTTTWATAFAHQLLARHGIVTRDVTAIERIENVVIRNVAPLVTDTSFVEGIGAEVIFDESSSLVGPFL